MRACGPGSSEFVCVCVCRPSPSETPCVSRPGPRPPPCPLPCLPFTSSVSRRGISIEPRDMVSSGSERATLGLLRPFGSSGARAGRRLRSASAASHGQLPALRRLPQRERQTASGHFRLLGPRPGSTPRGRALLAAGSARPSCLPWSLPASHASGRTPSRCLNGLRLKAERNKVGGVATGGVANGICFRVGLLDLLTNRWDSLWIFFFFRLRPPRFNFLLNLH